MRRGRIFLFLAFILILILVGVLVVWQFVLQPGAQEGPAPTPTPEPVKVVFVAVPVVKGDTLKAESIEARGWPEDQVLPEMFLESEMPEIVGRQVKYDLNAGIPLLRSMLLDPGEQVSDAGSPWAHRIPRGSVAVSIPVSRLSSVSYAPRPGDHVDVIASVLFVDLDTEFQSILPNYTGLVVASGPPDPETGERDPLTVEIGSLLPRNLPDVTGEMGNPASASPGVYGRVAIDPVLGQAVFLVPSEQQRARLVSQMLLQDVVVLQMGDFQTIAEEEAKKQQEEAAAQEGAAQETQPAEEAQPTVKVPDVVTLIVTPQDAVTLNYLMFSGAELTLALRNIFDPDRLVVNPVTLQFLLEQYQIPVPVRLPYDLHPRIDDLQQPVLQNDVVAP